jgi:peptidoglycan hydrolase-like protein with peptidoglycan-binding domain
MHRLQALALAVLVPALALTAVTLSTGPADAAGRAWVEKAQHRLNHLGCQAGPADGTIERWTRSAVIRFQSRTGRAQTGRLDASTRQRLYADGAPRCDRRPVPAASGAGRRIVISQRQNWLWLMGPKGGVVAQAGMVDNPQVLHRGLHRTGSYCGRSARIKRNTAAGGGVWLYNFVRFAPCGVGFHRIPVSQSSGRQIHPDWILGTNLSRSHGCIRLGRAMSLKVWNFTARPTPVRVL